MSRRLAAVAFVLFAFGGVAQAAESPKLSALERIDAALESGRIDRAEHALLAYRLLRARDTLPAEFQPAADEPPMRCGTEIARRAYGFSMQGFFTPDQQAQYAAIGGGRPNYPNSVVAQSQGVDVARIHYPSTVSSTVALEVAGYTTTSWDYQVGTLAWRSPPADGGTGGTGPNPDALYDIYLDPNEFGAFTQPENNGPENWDDASSFIVIQADVPAINTYVAHELNHALQFAYDTFDGDFVYEATATWMEDVVFDSVNDYEFFVPDFQSHPERTLSMAIYNDSYMYGGCVFFHYLSDVYGGPAVVRNVWENLRLGSNDWFDGVMTQLGPQGFGGMGEVYADFAGVRYLTGSRDDGTLNEASNFESVSIENAYNSFDDLGSGETTNPPMGMGANYIRVIPMGAGTKPVTFTLKSSEPGPWWVTAVGIPASGAADVIVFPDPENDGEIAAEVTNAEQYEQIGFVAVNTANAAQGADSSFGSGVSKDTHPFSWSFGGGSDDPTGCGCRIPERSRPLTTSSVLSALLFGAGVIVLRRRG